MSDKTETQELTPTTHNVDIDRDVLFTLYRGGDPEVLSKTYRLTKEGQLEKVAPGGLMRRGDGVICSVSDLNELAEFLPTMDHGDAISWGVPKDIGVGEFFTVVPEALVDRVAGSGSRKVIPRTRENNEYLTGEPGVFMGDIDEVGPGRPALTDAEQVAGLISDLIPELEDVEMLVVPSGSSCIKNSETGELLRGITGWRFYFIVDDASDIPRLGSILFKRLWLLGEGFIRASASGAALVRAPVDASVWQPERLDFVGGACLGPGLVQERPLPVVFPGARQTLDSRRVPDLTDEEEAEYQALVAAAKLAMKPELQRKADAAIERQVAKRVRADATEAELATVREAVRRTLNDTNLPSEHVIEVRVGNEWRQVTVAEIVSNRSAYRGMDTRDPHEPDYDGGRPIGQIYVNDSGVWLHSFAHGETTYFLEGSETMSETIWAELWDQLGIKLTALHPEEIAATQRAHSEAEARGAAGPQIADLDDWTKDAWRSLMPEGTDYEAQADKWLRDRNFDPAGGEGAKKRALVIDAMIGREELRAMVTHVGRRYCFNEAAGHEGEVVYDLRTGSMTSTAILGKTLAALKAVVPTVTASGNIGRSVKTAVAEWLESDAWGARKSISRFDFKPGSTQLFTPGETDDTVGVNIYRPRRYSAPPIDPAEAGGMFRRFLAHLVPDEREAAFLLNHVIGVAQRPDARGQAVLMISARGGAGRGTFFQILDAMIDPRFTRSLTTQDFVGSGAQWTEWEEHTIVAHVDEMATLGGDKYKAMAELDGRIELMPSRKPVTEKGKSRRTVTVYWTFFGAAMSSDAIALEKRDRRWTILTNTNVRFGDNPAVAATVSSMQEYPKGPISEAFAHGLNLWLQAQPFDYDMFIDGIETAAKRELLEASEGDIELTLRRVLNDYLKQDKHEVWISNVALETQSRMRNVERCSEAAVKKAWTKVPELFKQGFDGWEVPTNPGGKPQALRVASSTAEGEAELKRAAGSIARHRDAPKYTAEARRDVLGERRSR